MDMYHEKVAAHAYERKAELGGGFRGVVVDKRTSDRMESDVMPTLAEARNWVSQRQKRLGDVRLRLTPLLVAGHRPNRWR